MSSGSLRLDGRVALVTGAGRGIGWKVSQMLLERGANVLMFDRSEDDLARGISQLPQDAPILSVVGDVTSLADATEAVGAAVARWGRLDILVNNAGIGGATAPLWQLEEEDWRAVLDVNLNGVFICCKAAVPALLENGWGRIVNMASIAGKEGNPLSAHYSASKGGVIALTKSLGKELAERGVLVNAIAPAVIETELLTRSGVDPQFLESLLVKIPMRRMGSPDEVARLVGYLCSEELTFSTGAVYDLSGGRATY